MFNLIHKTPKKSVKKRETMKQFSYNKLLPYTGQILYLTILIWQTAVLLAEVKDKLSQYCNHLEHNYYYKMLLLTYLLNAKVK